MPQGPLQQKIEAAFAKGPCFWGASRAFTRLTRGGLQQNLRRCRHCLFAGATCARPAIGALHREAKLRSSHKGRFFSQSAPHFHRDSGT